MITLEMANKAIMAAQKKAEELKIKISVCIVDNNGLTIALNRMDNALPISPKFAFTKAYTASILQMPTDNLFEYAQPGKPYYGITSIWNGELTTIPGGLTVKKENSVIGGIGVGGGMPDQDKTCAEEAMKALQD